MFLTNGCFILVSSMFWRVLEPRTFSCGRLGFAHVDISIVLFVMFSNVVDFMDGVNFFSFFLNA